MEEEKEQQFQSFWSVIPTLLLEDEKIPLRAKKLYGLISSLCKKEGYCWASNKFLSEQSKIPIGTVRRYLKILENKNWIKSELIKEEGNERKIFLQFPIFIVKNSMRKQGAMSQNEHRAMLTITNNREQSYAHAPEQNIPNINKDKNKYITISKEIVKSASSQGKEINELIAKFKAINPSYERFFANKTQRGAMERLLKKMGREKLEQILDILPAIFGKPYAPRITSPLKLEEKLADLFAFMKERSEIGKQVFTIRPPQKNENKNKTER